MSECHLLGAPLTRRMKEEQRARIRDYKSPTVVVLWRAALAEATGTALLLLLGCLPQLASTPPSAARAALPFPFLLATLCSALGHVSGGLLNPAVSAAAAVSGALRPARAALLAAAQLAGAAAGAACLRALAPLAPLTTLTTLHAAPQAPPLCVTAPLHGLSVYKALCIESVLGAVLSLAWCAEWSAAAAAGAGGSRRGDSWPVRLGLVLLGLTLAAGPLTGASGNPARSFGPALCSGHFTHHWIYWVGPMLGAVSAAVLHRGVLLPRRPPALRSPPALRTPPAPPASHALPAEQEAASFITVDTS